MKRHLCVALILLLLTLTACNPSSLNGANGSVPGESSEQETTTVPEVTTVPETTVAREYTLEDLVSDSLNEKLSWTDLSGNDCVCKFRLPGVSSVIPDSEALNDKIYTAFEESIAHERRSKKDGTSNIVISINYSAGLRNGVLSLQVTEETCWDSTRVETWNIDIETGKVLDTQALLAALDRNGLSIEDALANAAKKKFISKWGDPSGTDSFTKERYNKTVSSSNLAKAKLFIKEDGTIWASIRVYSLAGADYYTYTVPLDI